MVASHRRNPHLAGDVASSMREALEDYRQVNQEYFLNKNGKFRPPPPGVQALGSSGDHHYQNESQALLGIERAYHFDRNDGIVGQAITRLCDHILPDDMSLDPQTNDDKLDQELRDRWYDWSYDQAQCDLEKQDTFPALERLALRNMFVGGDTFFLPLTDGSLQLQEAYRCRTARNTTRNILRGVEVNELRQRQAFWFTRNDVSALTRIDKVGDTKAVPAYDPDGNAQVFQLFDRKRQQLRGVSCMASCIDFIGMHGDLQFAALVKAQVSACFAIIREMSPGVDAPPLQADGTAQTGQRETETRGDHHRYFDQVQPGMMVRGRAGEKIQGFSPNVPNAEFFPHVKLILAIIAANVGLPPFMLLLDAQDVGNYGAGRQTIEQARVQFRRYQRMLIERLRTPVYLWKLRQWAADDPALARRLANNPRLTQAHEFKPAAWKYIDPTKDSKADSDRADNLLDARRRIAGERGMDYPQHVNECLDDNALLLAGACERAKKLNETFPEAGITWRDVLRLPKPATVAVSSDPDANPADEPAPTKTKEATHAD